MSDKQTVYIIFKTKHPEEYKVFMHFTDVLANRNNEIFISASKARYQPEIIIDALRKFHEIALMASDEELSYLSAFSATYAAYIKPDELAMKLNKKIEPVEVQKSLKESDRIKKSFPYLIELEAEAQSKGLIKAKS